MPELPEVETIRGQLEKEIVKSSLTEIEIFTKKSFHGDPQKVIGKTFQHVSRAGKTLILMLDHNLFLAIHLKLTGQLLYFPKRHPKSNVFTDGSAYTRVRIHLGDKGYVEFRDLRKFGWIKVLSRDELEKICMKLGPDALILTDKVFLKILQTSKRPIKIVLLDQEKIAGIGNIYANDALFLTRINPNRPANKISKQKAQRLLLNIKKVLNDSLGWKGASDNHYLDIYGQKGSTQDHFYVYGRHKLGCLNKCGSDIKRIQLGGRGTYFCPVCQK